MHKELPDGTIPGGVGTKLGCNRKDRAVVLQRQTSRPRTKLMPQSAREETALLAFVAAVPRACNHRKMNIYVAPSVPKGCRPTCGVPASSQG